LGAPSTCFIGSLGLVGIEWLFLSLSQLCFAMAIVMTNWKIGENWILCFGDLGSTKENSLYFIDGMARPRGISHISGFIISGHVNFKNYLYGSIIESLVTAVLIWVILLVPFLSISGVVLLFS
jgi:hypothetical protein